MKLPATRHDQLIFGTFIALNAIAAVLVVVPILGIPWRSRNLVQLSSVLIPTGLLLVITTAMTTWIYRRGQKDWVTVVWNQRTQKRIGLSCIAFIALYVGTYSLLSYFGRYCWEQSGEVRYAASGFSITDLEQWQPRFIFCQRFKTYDGRWITRANLLGHVYAPLVLLDQAYFHKTVRLFDPKTGRAIGPLEPWADKLETITVGNG